MAKVQERYLKKCPLTEWRFELRMRYFPTSIHDLLERDSVTFFFLYDQVSCQKMLTLGNSSKYFMFIPWAKDKGTLYATKIILKKK